MRASLRYSIRVEEHGSDEPGEGGLWYETHLYIFAPTWEDCLSFPCTEDGAWELVWELDGQETAERN